MQINCVQPSKWKRVVSYLGKDNRRTDDAACSCLQLTFDVSFLYRIARIKVPHVSSKSPRRWFSKKTNKNTSIFLFVWGGCEGRALLDNCLDIAKNKSLDERVRWWWWRERQLKWCDGFGQGLLRWLLATEGCLNSRVWNSTEYLASDGSLFLKARDYRTTHQAYT